METPNNTTDLAIVRNTKPVPEGYERHTNREIEEAHNAVMQLQQRRLDARDNEKRYATLRRCYLGPAHKVIQDLRNSIAKDYPAPEGWESETLPVGVAEARMHDVNAMLEDTQDIPTIPKHLYITDKDLPRHIKGESGDANQVAVSFLIDRLGWLYELEGDDEKDGTRAKE